MSVEIAECGHLGCIETTQIIGDWAKGEGVIHDLDWMLDTDTNLWFCPKHKQYIAMESGHFVTLGNKFNTLYAVYCYNRMVANDMRMIIHEAEKHLKGADVEVYRLEHEATLDMSILVPILQDMSDKIMELVRPRKEESNNDKSRD